MARLNNPEARLLKTKAMPAKSIGAPIKMVCGACQNHREAYQNCRRAYRNKRQRLPNREARHNNSMARHSTKKPSCFLDSLAFKIRNLIIVIKSVVSKPQVLQALLFYSHNAYSIDPLRPLQGQENPHFLWTPAG